MKKLIFSAVALLFLLPIHNSSFKIHHCAQAQLPGWLTVKDHDGTVFYLDAAMKLHPAKDPDAGYRVVRKENIGFLFAEAEELVKAMGASNPKAQAISLALAKGYYVLGETDKAKQLYNDFFKQYEGRVPTDPDLLRFYQDSAYQFGQMLQMAGDREGAIKAYSRVLATNPDRNVSRRLMSDQAELYVKVAAEGAPDQREKNLGEAKKLCETIQWGGMDIWFGQSIITMAHIAMEKRRNSGE